MSRFLGKDPNAMKLDVVGDPSLCCAQPQLISTDVLLVLLDSS